MAKNSKEAGEERNRYLRIHLWNLSRLFSYYPMQIVDELSTRKTNPKTISNDSEFLPYPCGLWFSFSFLSFRSVASPAPHLGIMIIPGPLTDSTNYGSYVFRAGCCTPYVCVPLGTCMMQQQSPSLLITIVIIRIGFKELHKANAQQ